MKRLSYLLFAVSLIAIGIIVIYNSLHKVEVLSKYNFDKDEWILLKGYHGDSNQYIITDKNVLNQLKEDWVLYKTDQEFATTGGYNIELSK